MSRKRTNNDMTLENIRTLLAEENYDDLINTRSYNYKNDIINAFQNSINYELSTLQNLEHLSWLNSAFQTFINEELEESERQIIIANSGIPIDVIVLSVLYNKDVLFSILENFDIEYMTVLEPLIKKMRNYEDFVRFFEICERNGLVTDDTIYQFLIPFSYDSEDTLFLGDDMKIQKFVFHESYKFLRYNARHQTFLDILANPVISYRVQEYIQEILDSE